MTTNQTIDGVPRDPRQWTDLQILDFLGVALRNVDLIGTVKLSEIRQGFEYMRNKQQAAQPQGEPVVFVDASELRNLKVSGFESFSALLYRDQASMLCQQRVALYVEQPAPVAQKYDDTLMPFLAMMRGELHANSHKGDREGWLRMTLEQALDEIRYHADKLIGPVMGRDGDRIREHAADVANCAMMLADIAGVLSRE